MGLSISIALDCVWVRLYGTDLGRNSWNRCEAIPRIRSGKDEMDCGWTKAQDSRVTPAKNGLG